MENGEGSGVAEIPEPWRIDRIGRCAVAVKQERGGQLALLLLLQDGTAIEVPLDPKAARSTGKALLAPSVQMP